MKRFLSLLFCLSILFPLFAQSDLLDEEASSVDSLFESPEAEPEKVEESTVIESLVKKPGMQFRASYHFNGAWAGGYSELPWFWDERGREFSQVAGAEMLSDLSLDLQISPRFRVFHSYKIDVPGQELSLGQLYCDYSPVQNLFFRLGKQSLSWGLSPNFSYADLPSRTGGSYSGDLYALRADLPIGIGGLQFLSAVRTVSPTDLDSIGLSDLAFGAKYNLALPKADLNLSAFYHKDLPLRSAFTAKTTLFGRSECYGELVGSFDHREPGSWDWAASLGLYERFFSGALELNLEYAYNREDLSSIDTTLDQLYGADETKDLLSGHNLALQMLFRSPIDSLRPFCRLRYNADSQSAELLSGLRIKPDKHLELYAAVPLALGSRSGYYYSNNADTENRPLALLLALRLKGSFVWGE